MFCLFVFHFWQEIQSQYASITVTATSDIPEIGRASFSHKKASKIADLSNSPENTELQRNYYYRELQSSF